MKVKTTHTTDADRASAVAFFNVLDQMYSMKEMEALDAFARNGELTVKSYADKVKLVDCWELGAEHEDALTQIVGVRDIQIGDSYSLCEFEKTANDHRFFKQYYDLLVIDSPQGQHKDSKGNLKCEHFDFLSDCGHLLKDEAVIVLYVNKYPYDSKFLGEHGYDQYDEYNFNTWMARRSMFYGQWQVTEEEAIKSYREVLLQQRLYIQQVVTVPCFSDVPGWADYAFRLALSVKRTNP